MEPYTRGSLNRRTDGGMKRRLRIWIASLVVVVTVAMLVGGVRFVENQTSASRSVSDMVRIPAGEFTMGSEADDPDAQPVHQVQLHAFAISRYEVTNAQYAHFLNGTHGSTDRCAGHVCLDTKLENPQSHILSRQGRYVVETGYEDHPVTNVSWYGAKAYCEHVGMRLPTEAEWEKAARGTDGRRYPWGDVADPTRLNAAHRRGETAPVGSYPEGVSPYGVHEMAGNVWEWTADWYTAYPGSSYANAFFGKKYKVVRGGSWNHPDSDARAAHRDLAHPARRIHVVGFRCARGYP